MNRLHSGTLVAGFFYLGVGIALLLDVLDVWEADLRLVLPIALVALGASILLSVRQRI